MLVPLPRKGDRLPLATWGQAKGERLVKGPIYLIGAGAPPCVFQAARLAAWTSFARSAALVSPVIIFCSPIFRILVESASSWALLSSKGEWSAIDLTRPA